eukprot:12846922-Alexandrium_andersonii.AAC.1
MRSRSRDGLLLPVPGRGRREPHCPSPEGPRFARHLGAAGAVRRAATRRHHRAGRRQYPEVGRPGSGSAEDRQ